MDPRAGLSLVWGRVSAGSAPNAIPDDAVAEGTLRCLDDDAWHAAPDIIKELLDAAVAPYRATAELEYRRGVPPTVNEAGSVALLREAVGDALGPEAEASTPQSLGGEDFAWYLEHVPGALARLGTHPVDAAGPMLDLHRGTFDVDEGAIGAGVRLMAGAALRALGQGARPGSVAGAVEGAALM